MHAHVHTAEEMCHTNRVPGRVCTKEKNSKIKDEPSVVFAKVFCGHFAQNIFYVLEVAILTTSTDDAAIIYLTIQCMAC